MEKLSQGLEWLGRKIWILLRVLVLMIFVIPDLILEESKSQPVLLITGLVTVGIVGFFWWRAEKNSLPVWDSKILSWDGMALVILSFAIMQLTDMAGSFLLELQGAETTVNETLIMESLKGVPFWLAILTTAFLPAVGEEVMLRATFSKIIWSSCHFRNHCLKPPFWIASWTNGHRFMVDLCGEWYHFVNSLS